MGNYQPQQGLTWKYTAANGKLAIIVKIFVGVGPNERMTITVSSVQGNAISILISLNGNEDSPITKTIEVANLNPNLSQSQVRAALANMPPFMVTTTFYGNSIVEGEVINTSSQHSEIVSG